MSAADRLREMLDRRIVVLDGSWGVLMHRRGLSEADYRGERLRDHARDVKGDPDLLNLTQPHVVAELHDAYFEAGADITSTNTFTATSIGQADYGLEALAAEMSLRGCSSRAQSGRRLDGAHAGAAEVRRRRDRTAQRVPVRLAEGRRSRLPAGDLRRGARDLRGADRSARGGRCRPAPRRDDLRHAEREGGDRGRRRRRSGASALALVHGDRPQRPQPLRPDRGGVLGLGRARAAR